ncbi:MAG: M20/M25/M40 family metallo-hydrolase, partial [Roseovarius sp.]|nr:M20/M25/M40 family metallo-hydrolase [Roseovarius sp.]
MSDLDKVLAHIDADFDNALDRLFQTVRLKSISTDPAYADETRACAEWHSKDLASIGFASEVRETPGHPVVFAKNHDAAGTKVLFYGHYDVQPADPLDLWEDDPFEPKIATLPDGSKEIRGRGASDDKGQLMTFVEACRAWKSVTGKLPIPITIMLEGEEESGGVNLPGFLDATKDELQADVAMICDTNMWDKQTPAITTSLRGLCAEEIFIHAADRDLHSGFYGSAAANPNHILARIIADLRDANGRITIPGFYDGVPDLPESLRKSWESLDFSEKEFLGE